jgi:hypothetical protein
VETNLLHMQIPDAKTPCVHAKGNKKQQCVSIPGMLRDLAAGIRMETNVYARKPCRTTAYISRPGEKRGKKRQKANTPAQRGRTPPGSRALSFLPSKAIIAQASYVEDGVHDIHR